MPVWITSLASVITLFILLGGALNFPYLPMWFGIYGADRHSLRGKLIFKLIWLFPVVAIVCLLLGWTSNGLYTLMPIVYVIIVWLLRPNKDDSSKPSMRYRNSHENLEARMAEVDYRWAQWTSQTATHQYLLINLFASSRESAEQLKSKLTVSENLHSDIDISFYENNTASVYARIKLDAVEKDAIVVILKRIIDIAWQTGCEVFSIDVMEEE